MLPFLDQIGYSSVGLKPAIPTLSEEDVLSLIDEASAVTGLRTVSFTGGEPTLLGNTLRKAIARATALGLLTAIVTNASWAKTPASTAKTLDPLVEAGLDQIFVSYSDYHAEFVPIDSIRNCYKAAIASHVKIVFGITLHNNCRVTPQFIQEEVPVERQLIGDLVSFCVSNVVPTGRATLLDEADFIRGSLDEDAQLGCASVITRPAVTPDGKIFACCGWPHREIPELEVGNIKQEGLKSSLDSMTRDVLINWIHTKGPWGILKTIRPDFEPTFTNICEGCKFLFTDPLNRNLLETYLETHSAEEILYGDTCSSLTPYQNLRKLLMEALSVPHVGSGQT